MKLLFKILYIIYQIIIGLPVLVFITIFTALEVGIGTTFGNGHFWGYYPGRWWAKIIVRTLLLPIKIEGKENLEKDQSYVFVANHQGIFDIFVIYGYLGRNFKWMMKYQLGKIRLSAMPAGNPTRSLLTSVVRRRFSGPMSVPARFCRRDIV